MSTKFIKNIAKNYVTFSLHFSKLPGTLLFCINGNFSHTSNIQMKSTCQKEKNLAFILCYCFYLEGIFSPKKHV